MITIGQTHKLKIAKACDMGMYLDAENLGEVLLPRKYVPENAKQGDSIYVFIYQDSKNRIVATTQTPKAKVGEFAWLKVTEASIYGAFLDWGLDKDLLVPFGEQYKPMEVGHFYIVRVYLDKINTRITASSKIDKFLDNEPPEYEPQQSVDLLIANTTDLGYKAIINHSHWGVLYKTEVFQTLSYGQYKKGFIQRLRPDGKIDLSLQGGQETRDKYGKIILNYLQNQNGFAPVHDKSSPKEIADLFGMSKGAFKKAIGSLFKQGEITISKEGIRLTTGEV